MSEARSPVVTRITASAAIAIALLAALLCGAGAAAGSAHAASARGVLTFKPGGGAGDLLRVRAVAPARQGRVAVELPVAALDLRRPARVKLRGALRLKVGRLGVVLRNPRATVGTSRLALSARLGGKRRVFLVTRRPARRPTVKRGDGELRLRRMPVALTRGGARALRAALGLEQLAPRSFGHVALNAKFLKPKRKATSPVPSGPKPSGPGAPVNPPAGPPADPDPYAFCPITTGSGPGSPGGEPAPPLASPTLAAPSPIGSGGLSWGFKASFRAYVSNGNGNPPLSGLGGATIDPGGSFAFPVDGGQFEDGQTPRAVVNGEGEAVFCFPSHFFRIAMLNPTATIDGPQSRLTADIDSNLYGTEYGPWRTDVATLDSSAVEPQYSNDGQTVTWAAVPATLTADGAAAFGGLYTAGTALDPVTVTAGDELAGPETRVASRADVVHDPDQAIGDSDSEGLAVSANGRYVAFDSYAGNLIPGDTFDSRDVFVRDLLTRRTTRVSVDSAGQPGTGSEPTSHTPQISADGRYVVFVSGAALSAADTNDEPDVYLRDTVAETTTLITVATDESAAGALSGSASISADGRRVAFFSASDGLAADDDDGVLDMFVRDLEAETTTRVSLADGGAETAVAVRAEGGISADGQHVVFGSPEDALVAGDDNGRRDVFVRDLADATTTRVSLGDDETQVTGTHVELGSAAGARISADGNRVVFYSTAATLVAGDGNNARDCFVRDVAAETTQRVNVDATGAENVEACDRNPTISPDGSTVAFSSVASDLVAGDANGIADVFVRAVADPATIRRANVATAGTEAAGTGSNGAIALGDGGRQVAFESASLILTGSNEGRSQVLVRELP
jgi:Tol biopolymer transport system component